MPETGRIARPVSLLSPTRSWGSLGHQAVEKGEPVRVPCLASLTGADRHSAGVVIKVGPAETGAALPSIAIESSPGPDE